MYVNVKKVNSHLTILIYFSVSETYHKNFERPITTFFLNVLMISELATGFLSMFRIRIEDRGEASHNDIIAFPVVSSFGF